MHALTFRIAMVAIALRLAGSGLTAGAADEPVKPPVLLELSIKGALSEEPAPLGLDGAPVRDNLGSLIERIRKAKADPVVKGIVLKLREPSIGMAKASEITRSIRDFRASGKKVFALLEMGSNIDYLIATAADEIVMPESGWLMIKGFAAEVTFYKGLFDKLGIAADMMQVGEYKGAAEPYTRTSMSPAFREELASILTERRDLLAETISARQGIALDDAKKLIDGGPYTPADAKKLGLINRVAYDDQVETEIAKALGFPNIKLDSKYGKAGEKVDYSGFAGFMKMISALAGESTKKPESKKPKIAVIHAAGTITSGKSSGSSLMGEATMGADTIIQYLRRAEKNPTVKAIVLRVDSPGGSALASDLMWREITRIDKPIVAAMSDVAASGGYYISMGCDKIFAAPGTLTGSIGVVGGKIALGGLMEKVGLAVDTLEVGKNGTIMSVYKPFTDSERQAMKKLMEETYKQFVGKAAKGRKMDFAKLEKLAGGRIYSGRQAKAIGLVDEIGTLEDAIKSAKDLAKLSGSDDVEILSMPEPQGILESLLGPLDAIDAKTPTLSTLLPEKARRILARAERLATLLQAEPAVAIVPFEIEIH